MIKIRSAFGKWALCDGKTENGEFGLGNVIQWYDTLEEVERDREIIRRCYE